MRRAGEDERGVSEGAGVAALVFLTMVVTASVGIGVLFVDDDETQGLDASFSFQYFSERSALLITYEEGQELGAENVTVSGPQNNVTWATLRDLNASATISPGDRAQLNAQNAYGGRVTDQDSVRVLYTGDGNTTVVSTWNGSAA